MSLSQHSGDSTPEGRWRSTGWQTPLGWAAGLCESQLHSGAKGDDFGHRKAGWRVCREELLGMLNRKHREFPKLARCVMRDVCALWELLSLSSRVL